MLVALDSAQLINLAHPKTPAVVVREFRDAWEAHKCELALTDSCMREFIYGAGANLALRQEVLTSLGTLRGIPHPNRVYQNEFVAHVTAVALGEPVDSYLRSTLDHLRTRFFRPLNRVTLKAAVEAARLNASKRRDFDGVVAEGQDLIRVLGELWPPKLLESMTRAEAIERAFAFTEDLPEPLRTAQREHRTREIDAYYRNRKNRRGFLTISFDIANLEIARTAPYADFPEIGYLKKLWFSLPVRRLLTLRGLVKDHEHAQAIVSKLSPYMLPGVSLRMAMLREQARDREREVELSDIPDSLSLMSAPYVDLACVDKRVYPWIERARLGKHANLLLPGIGDNLVDARSLTHVAEAISSRSREAR